MTRLGGTCRRPPQFPTAGAATAGDLGFPGARLKIEPDPGHLSLVSTSLPAVLADRKAIRRPTD